MSVFEKNVSCEDVAPLLVFYACDEVSDKERKQIEAHIATCAACAARLAEESDLQKAMLPGYSFRSAEVSLPKRLTIFPRLRFRNTGDPSVGCAAGWRCGLLGAALCWFSSGSWWELSFFHG